MRCSQSSSTTVVGKSACVDMGIYHDIYSSLVKGLGGILTLGQNRGNCLHYSHYGTALIGPYGVTSQLR